ncbi:MAG: helix-turn-helix domain-containing protein [bacterium]
MLKDKFLEFLTLSGMGEYERAALACLALEGDGTPPQVASRTSIPKSKVYDVLDGLEKKNLVYQVALGKKRYKAVRPEDFMPQLMKGANDMSRLSSEIRGRLVEVYEGAQEIGTGADVEGLVQVLAGRGAKSSSLLAEFKSAKEEIIVADSEVAWLLPGTALGDLLKSTVAKVRILCTGMPARHEATGLIASGLQVRVTESLSSAFVVVDRRDAYLAVQGASDGPACVHAQQKPLAADLARLFNQAWESGRPVVA